jgi:hypothetical protein
LKGLDAMSETLQEFVDSRGVTMRVDRSQGILRGVKVLGLRSRNGRTYLPEALQKAAPLYEDTKVNVNHPKVDPLAARDYQDRIGSLRNVSVRADEGLFADFHFNPKHVLAEQLLWDVEHAPQNVGFSHNVLARTVHQGNQIVVEAITRVHSVDLVADPATTQGLFESAIPGQDDLAPAAPANAQVKPSSEPRGDLVDTLLAESAQQLEQTRGELARAEAEIERLRVSEAAAQRQLLIRGLLDEAGLSRAVAGLATAGSAITDRFLETLAQAQDESTVRELIRDRAALVERLRRADADAPRSHDQIALVDRRPMDAPSFVKAIT